MAKFVEFQEYMNPIIANEANTPLRKLRMKNEIDRLRDGEIFDDLVEAWKRLGRLVYHDHATDPNSLERATGLLYMTRYLTAGATLTVN